MIKKILALAGLALVALLAVAFFKSPDYEISREIRVAAPADRIFPWINESKKSYQWMPWQELDPKMVITYFGGEGGVGSGSSWTSEGQMGVGTATVTATVPNQSVRTRLDYTKPFTSTQDSELSIRPDGAESVVRWSVKGRNTFPARIFCLFMNMDKMVGGMFEQGLTKLKRTVEASR